MPDVQVGTARVKGSIAGLHDLDIDLAKVQSSVLAGTERTSIKVDRYSVTARGLTASTLQGTSATFIEMPSSTGKNLSVWASFDGFLGDVQVAARAGLDGSELDLAADVPKARAEAVRAFFPAWPIFDDVGAHLQAKGPPASLALKGAATVGDGAVVFGGDLSLEGGWSPSSRSTHATSIFARSRMAPLRQNSRRSGAVNIAVHGGTAEGSAELETSAFRIDPVDVPAGVGHRQAPRRGGFRQSQPARSSVAIGRRLRRSPRRRRRSGRGTRLDSASARDLSRALARERRKRSGSVACQGTDRARCGRCARRRQRNGFKRAGIALEQASISGSLRGPFAHLGVNASLKGQRLQAGPLFFPEVQATAEGPLVRPTVSATGSGANATTLSAKASIEPKAGGAKLASVEVRAEREGIALSGKVGFDRGGERFSSS